LVKAVFTEEDRRNLKTLTDEVPKLRLLVEELIETLEILGHETLTESIKASEKDFQEGRLLGFKEFLKELSLDEQEIDFVSLRAVEVRELLNSLRSLTLNRC